MTRQEAIKILTDQFEQQCEKYPRTREIGLALYLRRNLPHFLRNRRNKERVS